MIQAMVQFPCVGCIVEFMQSGTVQIAYVLEEQNGKMRLLLPNRREMPLHSNRLLPWLGPVYHNISTKEQAIELLTKHHKLRQELLEQVDAYELWNLSQNELDNASAIWFTELVFSEPNVDQVAACGQALLNLKSHFKFNQNVFEIFSADYVNSRLAEHELLKVKENFTRQALAWLNLLWEVHNKRRSLPEADSSEYPDSEIADNLKDLILRRIADPDNAQDESTWKNLTKLISDDSYLPLYLATAWGLVPQHYNFWLDLADYQPGDKWAREFEKELKVLTKLATRELDFNLDYNFISIDSATTQDIDDAFYLEKNADDSFEVHIALACPALNWNFDSPLGKYVAKRGTSLYVPEATHHMLPEILSTQCYSLKQGQTRPSLVLSCHISAIGEVLSCTPRLASVQVEANLIYEDVENTLNDGNSAADKYAPMLKYAHELGILRKQYRVNNGAVIIERPDPLFTLHENLQGEITVELEDSPNISGAHLIVSELMILSNSAIGEWAVKNNVSLLYRTQDITIPKEYVGVWFEPHKISKIVRSLTPAKIETNPKPHVGVGENVYAPTTSPLRRYPDLINEAQILNVLHEKTPRWSKEELDQMLLFINARLEVVGQVQKMRPRYWKLLYVKQKGDYWWDGVITDENDNFVWVSLPKEQLVLRGRRNLFEERTHPGQEIQVRLHKISPLHNEISIAQTREV